MSRSRSVLAALTGGALILSLAAGLPPAQAESGERPDLPLSSDASDLDVPLDGVTVVSPPGPAGDSQVQVMLELDPAPASTVYARTQRDGERAATKAARTQVARIESLQSRIRPQLREPATRATVLFEAARVYSGIAVQTQADRLPALAGIPGVRALHTLVPKTIGNYTTIPLVQAPAAWTGVSGVTGDGVTIGIIDTGIDYTHATFGGAGTPSAYDDALAWKEGGSAPSPLPFPSIKVAGGYDFAGNDYTGNNTPTPDANPLDCNGHGSHVAGTAAGYGVRSDHTTYPGPWTDSAVPFDTMRIGPGVAPEATLYGLKVFGCTGSTNLVIPALEWAADPDGDSDFSDHLDVVNMSLGSDFGSPDDPDSVATNNTVDAGVVVAASIGNSGDVYETGGSPGNARKTIATAASVDDAEVVDGIVLGGSDVPTPGTYPALQSGAYTWAGPSGVTDGDVVRLGDWDAAPSAVNNTDGCHPLSGPDATAVSGKVVALYWDPSDDTRTCGSADRSDRVAGAGATGAILVSAETFFTTGVAGSTHIPVMLVSAPGSNQIIAGLDAGVDVTATMTNALHNSLRNEITGADDPTDEIVSFSSRGNALANGVKPDVSAPGTTIFSTAVGTGYDGITESGTSMASPHVAGLAALVAAKHPDWAPEEIKAAVINTANHDLIVGPAGALPRFDVLRAGSGRIDALQATRSEAVAYVVDDPGAVSVSFGVLDVTESRTVTKTVRIADKRATGSRRTYAVGIEMVNSLPGATYSASASSVRLGPGETADVTVTLSLDPTRLVHVPDPTIDLNQGAIGVMREYLTSVSGRLIVLPPAGYPLRLPLFAAPRPSSSLSGGSSAIVDGTGSVRTGTMTMTGTGVDNTGAEIWENEISSVSGMELLATSPQIPACSPSVGDCIPYEDIGSADARYLGATSDAPLITSAGGDPLDTGLAWFGIAAWQPWRTAASVSEYYVYLDLTGDGTEDAIVFNSRYANTDVLVSYTLDVASCDPDGCDVVDMQLLNNSSGARDTHLMYGNVLTMPVALDALAGLGYSADNPRVGMWLETYAATGLVDTIGSAGEPVHADLLQPGVTVFGSAETLPQAVTAGDALRVTLNKATAQASPMALLLHHLNAGADRAQVVPVEDAAPGFAASPNPLALGPVTVPTSASGTVTVTSSGTKALTFGSGAVSIAGPDAGRFSITSDGCSGRTVAPSATCAVGVQFTPTGSGAAAASLVFVDDAATSPQTVALTGNATLAAPTVSAISPASGPAGGGTPVTVTGTGFSDGATVTIAGTAATSVVRSSATAITAVTPAGSAGAADVVVTNPDGQQGTLAGGFTFEGATEPIVQRATRPLNLPRRLARQGWTKLFTVPVITNAGQRARWRVSTAPQRLAVPRGDRAYARVVRRDGAVWIWLSGTRASVVRVRLHADAVTGYTAYAKVRVYRTRAAR